MTVRAPSAVELAALIMAESDPVRRCWLEDRYWAKTGVAHSWYCRDEYERLSGQRNPALARFRRVWRSPALGAVRSAQHHGPAPEAAAA